jgi:SAM-dependent methyltransferase
MKTDVVSLSCPECRTKLKKLAEAFHCGKCKRDFPIVNGIICFNSEEIKKDRLDDFYNKWHEKRDQEERKIRKTGRLRKLFSPLLWLESRVSPLFGDQQFFSFIIKSFSPGLLLDLGCGRGHELSVRLGSNVVGLDISMNGLLHCSANKRYNLLIQCDAVRMPFENETFDYVFAKHFVGHVPVDLKDVLYKEIWRILKPHGKLFAIAECDSINPLYRFAHRYPDLFEEIFIWHAGGHVGLELPSRTIHRFRKNGFNPILEKRNGIIAALETYMYLFDNEYKEQSTAIKVFMYTCVLLSKTRMDRIIGIASGILNPVLTPLFPLDYAQLMYVIYEKKITKSNKLNKSCKSIDNEVHPDVPILVEQ